MATTTSRHLPDVVRSGSVPLLLRTSSRERSAIHVGCVGVRFPKCSTHTQRSVLSTASWAPPNTAGLGRGLQCAFHLWRRRSRFMSRKNALNLTLAPASRHTRANMRSMGVARFRNVPVREHAALWRPNVSRGSLQPEHTASSNGRGAFAVGESLPMCPVSLVSLQS